MKWFRIENSTEQPNAVDIHIVDVIASWDADWLARNYGYDMGVTARAFVEALAKLDPSVTAIRVHINSPGGDVFAAINIANALREQQMSKGRTVETIVDGLAASAASIVMMAGSTVRISDNALVMIHNPWSMAVGNAADLRKTADALDTVRDTIVATYQWHSPLSAEELVALLDAETWMTADESVAKGFATEKVAGLKAAALLTPKAIKHLNVPAQFKDRVAAFTQREPEAPAAMAAADVLAACEAAGLDLAFARALIADRATSAQVETRVAAEKTARTAAATRAAEITALCATAKVPTLAAGYIAGAMAPADVRAHLTLITALTDKGEIDGAVNLDAGHKPAARIDTAAIYAERNAK